MYSPISQCRRPCRPMTVLPCACRSTRATSIGQPFAASGGCTSAARSLSWLPASPAALLPSTLPSRQPPPVLAAGAAVPAAAPVSLSAHRRSSLTPRPACACAPASAKLPVPCASRRRLVAPCLAGAGAPPATCAAPRSASLAAAAAWPSPRLRPELLLMRWQACEVGQQRSARNAVGRDCCLSSALLQQMPMLGVQ